jgi:hypothetical protein
MAVVGSLWVGGPLGYVQKVCLSSFIYYGHTVNLYVYDMDMEVPKGVNKLDASKIINEDKIFKHHGQYAAFADYFRYKMIQKTGIMWVDADTICLSNKFFEDQDFVFIQESEDLFANGILKLPKDHEITTKINLYSERIILKIIQLKDKAGWTALGPALLTKLVKQFQLEKYAQPAIKVNVLDHWSKGRDFWNPEKTDTILKICENAYSATVFTGILRKEKFNTEQVPPKGSAIEFFSRKFGLL